jgi:hypothetical protein
MKFNSFEDFDTADQNIVITLTAEEFYDILANPGSKRGRQTLYNMCLYISEESDLKNQKQGKR